MNYQAIATQVYGAFLFIGGAIGYYTASSLPSLIMGTLFALLVSVCALGMFKGCSLSRTGARILSLLLLSFFTYRFMISYKFFPPGMMVLLSLSLLLYLQFGKKTPTKESKCA